MCVYIEYLCVCVCVYIYIVAALRETPLCDTYNVGNRRRKMAISTCAFLLTEETIRNLLLPGSLAPPESAHSGGPRASPYVIRQRYLDWRQTLVICLKALSLSDGGLISEWVAAMGLACSLGILQRYAMLYAICYMLYAICYMLYTHIYILTQCIC